MNPTIYAYRRINGELQTIELSLAPEAHTVTMNGASQEVAVQEIAKQSLAMAQNILRWAIESPSLSTRIATAAGLTPEEAEIMQVKADQLPVTDAKTPWMMIAQLEVLRKTWWEAAMHLLLVLMTTEGEMYVARSATLEEEVQKQGNWMVNDNDKWSKYSTIRGKSYSV